VLERAFVVRAHGGLLQAPRIALQLQTPPDQRERVNLGDVDPE
jgi:hypothetical protein